MEKQIAVSVTALQYFMKQALMRASLPEAEAEAVIDNIFYAELQGISSHGLTRFHIYLKRVEDGFVNPRPQLTVTKLMPAVVTVDGDNGLGAVVAARALAEGMAVAEQYGICAVGVKRSNHFGAAGYYCETAAEKGYISIILTNGPPALPPWGGSQALFGTNPMAFGIPCRSRPHIVVDMATSMVARGKIIAAAKEGQTIPDNWALDKQGRSTTDPAAALQGVLLPMAGPKGYALSLVVDHLSGVLTGAGFGSKVINQYSGIRQEANVGHFIILVKPDAICEQEVYFQRTEEFISLIKAVPVAPGFDGIRIPGERGWECQQRKLGKNLRLSDTLAKELLQIAVEREIEFRLEK